MKMVKEEIVEGLRLAVFKGEPLEKAMASFYNAGYSKEDIEEAARILQAQQFQQSSTYSQQPQQSQQSRQSNFKPLPPPPLTSASTPIQNYPGIVQRVSSYGKTPSRKGSAVTIILFALLLILFGILAAVVFFKDELSGFFNNLFWRALY